MNLLCAAIGLWCAATSPERSIRYEDTVHVVLPIEAFGANYRIKNYRKKVLAPEYFDLALNRALAETKRQNLPVKITVAPASYRSKGINLSGFEGTLDFGRSSVTIYGSLEMEGGSEFLTVPAKFR